MLALILIWIYVFVSSWLLGTSILYFTKSSLDRVGDRAILSSYIGFVVFGSLLLIISLFTALTPQVGLLFSLSSLLLFLIPAIREELKNILSSFSVSFFASIIALFLAVAFYSVQIVTWYDTGLYHYGIVQWLSEFGTVPGLALIHNRFGFISSWFSLTAPLDHGFLKGRVATLMDGGFLCLALLHYVIALVRIFHQRFNSADLFWGACIPITLIIPLLFNMPASLSPDFPCIIFIITLGWLFLNLSDNKNTQYSSGIKLNATTNKNLLPVIFAAGALSIKLNALPAVGIALLFYWQNEKFHMGKMALSVGIVALFMVPVILAGIVSSGCPLYPIPFCIDFPWSLGEDNAIKMTEIIKQFARWRSSTPPIGVPAWAWVVHWFNMALINKVVALYISASLIILFFIIILKSYKRIPGILWVATLGLLGMIFFLSQAPDWRFGWAYLSIIPSLSVFFLVKNKIRKPLNDYISGYFPVTVIVSLLLFASLLHKTETEKGISSTINSGNLVIPVENSMILPPQLISFQCAKVSVGNGKCHKCSTLETSSHKVYDIEYVSPKSTDQCWASPIPCSPSLLSGVQLKNPEKGMAAGFVKVP